MSSTFHCDMDALTPQQRRRHGELAKELRPLVAEFREIPDGYVDELRSPRNLESSIDEFMTLESTSDFRRFALGPAGPKIATHFLDDIFRRVMYARQQSVAPLQ